MYKVLEISEKLGVSKVSVYNKIKQHSKELNGHIHKVKSVTYVDDKGFNIISDSFNLQDRVTVDEEQKVTKTSNTESLSDDLTFTDDRINDLKGRIQYLEEHIEKKDALIFELVKNKDEHITILTKQMENYQVLLKDKPILLEGDTKKSIWKRLFDRD